MDKKIFYEYVGQELTDYDHGNGDAAHEVLARIQKAYDRVDERNWNLDLQTRQKNGGGGLE